MEVLVELKLYVEMRKYDQCNCVGDGDSENSEKERTAKCPYVFAQPLV